MFKQLAVVNGDNVNRYGYRFTIGALEDSMFQKSLTGVPSLLGHDSHKPIGWNFPLGLYFEPHSTRLVALYLLTDTDEDQEYINRVYQNELIRRNQELCKPFLDEFSKLLSPYTNDTGHYIYCGCVSYHEKGILYRLYPELHTLKDKDGLVYLDQLLESFEYLGQGIFKCKKSEIAIFCHSFFRRNLSRHNNFHYHFLDQFIRLNDTPDITLRVALDDDLIGYSSTFNEQIELEYWWGPKYNDNIDEIPLGVTHYECDKGQRTFSGVSGTQFWWKGDEESMILELEELKDNPTLGVSAEMYGCRYIHSIYLKDTFYFDHFDGAVRMYEEDQMLQRLEQPINKAGKNTDYTKLFRIDGKLSISTWKSLTTHYFQDNPLLYEYFGHKEEYRKLRENFDIPLQTKGVVESLVPYKLKREEGIRLFVSYHKPSPVTLDFERTIINPDTITSKNGKIDIIEFDALEVKKALNRLGEDLTIPDGLALIKCHDAYINYPTILHSPNNVEENLGLTLQAYYLLLKSICKRADKYVSFTLAWPFEDKEAKLSIYGHVAEIVEWLKVNQHIPLKHSDFRVWLENQNKWLSGRYSCQSNKPDLFELVNGDGVIYVKRRSINPDWVQDITNDENGLKYKLEIPEDNRDLLEAIQKNDIHLAFSTIVSKARCGKTSGDYFTSTTSKYLDNDVYVVLEECSLAGAFWTDKP
ncbi:hypothetical protein H9Q13_16650 [Pontibacter sp. JH31]|uniref:Uncharacterized protein n=1 Tax=Pontibacter aquaedesilientis TaxID=2766980 RepID=A0ABR7XKI2_9BACT|nr:hypothetical protein [Pontibacter aquaedesilientis]MBD1398804.1 hypothetical protein [Pontibacter aquaedesilientis]